MRHTMMSALKITADRIAENGLARCMTLSAFSCGYVVTNAAGMMAKYLATSLAMLNVASAPRVISICLPVSTTSMSLVGLESRSTMLPASLAACVPVFMATATSACASAGASLVPSPVMATKEAGNMVDLDSNPTKLIEVVETGKQMLMTRGALATFSIANDVAKYFAIIPAAFVTTYPQLNALNVMHLASPFSAILSAVIFNALIIVCLIPLALQGVRYRALGAAILLRRNLLVYGLGGILVPFAGIKLVDLGLVLAHLA